MLLIPDAKLAARVALTKVFLIIDITESWRLNSCPMLMKLTVFTLTQRSYVITAE